MSRPILVFIILIALAVAIGLLFLRDTELQRIGVRPGASGDPASRDSLTTNTEYYFEIDGIKDGAGLIWHLQKANASEEVIAEENSKPAHSFSDTGRYYLRCLRHGELVASDSMRVRQGDLFDPRLPKQTGTDTVGHAFFFDDRSQNVIERKWAVMRNDTLMELPTEASWSLTPSVPGTYVVKLDVTMRSGEQHSESMMLRITPPPPPDLEAIKRRKLEEDRLAKEAAARNREAELARKKAEADAKRRTDAEAAARRKAEQDAARQASAEAAARKKAEQDAARLANAEAAARKKAETDARNKAATEEQARLKREAEERKKAEREEKEAAKRAAAEAARIAAEAANVGPCFAPKRTVTTPVRVEMPDPARTDVKFQGGKTEFELEVREDCKPHSLKHFANATATAGRMKITFKCLTDDCSGDSAVSVLMQAAMDAEKAAERLFPASTPMLAAGKTYLVSIETSDELELGFFDVSPTTFSSPSVTLSFRQNTSCAFDLVFKK